MIHPSYVELMRVVNDNAEEIGEEPVVNSRYSIVTATAKRARQIIDGDEPLIDTKQGDKPLSTAVAELYSGELKILTDEEAEIAKAEAEEAARIAAEQAAAKAAEEAAKAAEENAEAEATEE